MACITKSPHLSEYNHSNCKALIDRYLQEITPPDIRGAISYKTLLVSHF